jgi:hypothetical protein
MKKLKMSLFELGSKFDRLGCFSRDHKRIRFEISLQYVEYFRRNERKIKSIGNIGTFDFSSFLINYLTHQSEI